ncbi:MAG: hypothetical protein KF780_13570 [Sphingomonas sp.]|nr:hypothetical protein [Sphingomonas sp.]
MTMPIGTILATALKSAVVLLVCMALAIVVGVIAATIFDVAPVRGQSDVLPYAIWLVLGIFTGLIAYGSAGGWATPGVEDWTAAPGARRTGRIVLVTSIALLAGLTMFFHWLYWSRGVAGEYFVPDSASHSILFFVSVLAGMVFASFALISDKKDGADAQ